MSVITEIRWRFHVENERISLVNTFNLYQTGSKL